MKKYEMHGQRHTPEYEIWKTMIQRCHNPKSQRYALYGGRGIVVCEKWRNSFSAFLADMGQRTTAKHWIERKENDVGYRPDNCTWSIQADQAANKRNTIRLTLDGETLHLSEWARRIGISHRVLGRRLERGWSVEKALRTPPMNTGRNHYGKTKTA